MLAYTGIALSRPASRYCSRHIRRLPAFDPSQSLGPSVSLSAVVQPFGAAQSRTPTLHTHRPRSTMATQSMPASGISTPQRGPEEDASRSSSPGAGQGRGSKFMSTLSNRISEHRPAHTSPAAGFVPPIIPATISASISAWWNAKPTRDGAQAELHLYRRSGYFEGATLGNATGATSLAEAWATISDPSQLKQSVETLKGCSEEDLVTVATRLNPKDGKVGVLRMVNLDAGEDLNGAAKHSWWPWGKMARKLNMLEIGTPVADPNADEFEEKIVLLHGYGSGTGFFFQNIANLASIPSSRLYALDWLGMGRSARVPFHVPSAAAKTVKGRVTAAESFFVESLEQWREAMGLKKMTIIGHSLGGYLSLAYTMKYPERVSRLVLVSPAGIGNNPNDNTGGVERELTDSQQETTQRTVKDEQLATQAIEQQASAAEQQAKRDDGSLKASAAQPQSPSRAEVDPEEPPRPRIGKRTRSVFAWMWDQNVSPFSLLRNSFFLAPWLIGKYTTNRFGLLPDEELRSLHAYVQSIFTARGSSEYCLAHLLAPGAFARWPMIGRVQGIDVPVSFIYGSHDWMDEKSGKECVQKLREQGNTRTNCFVVPRSGHYVHLDNPIAFDHLVKKILLGQRDSPRD